MGIGVGSFLGRYRSLILLVLEKVEPESGIQGSAVRVAGSCDGVVVVVAESE
jgi:hypothetical protein